ncbi:MAG TPA: AIR synthase related protein [Myxococcales bacterium]
MSAPPGQDIDLKVRCSSAAFRWARKTFDARDGKPGEVDRGLNASFASILSVGGKRLGVTSDGIGTKVEVAERTGVYSTLGYDLLAMVADDLAANGIEPTNLTNILDVDKLDERVVDELMRGLSQAALESGVSVVGGEIAELGRRVGGWGGGMHFNWCATALGVLPDELERPIDGAQCAPGDAIVAIREHGLRSNGFSLARSILSQAHGERWHEARCQATGESWGAALLTPSRVCCTLVRALVGEGVVPHGIAHVTGGGIPDKLGRVLKVKRLGAYLGTPFEPPAFVQELVGLGQVPARVAWRHWNMGNAMLVVLAPGDVERSLAVAARGRGFEARVAGQVVEGDKIRIAQAGEAAVEAEVN